MRRATAPRASDVPRVLGFAEDHLPHTILHPSQFRDIWNGVDSSPERELAVAVLEAALADLRNFRYAKRRRRQRLFWQAHNWVMSDDREWPFSFVNICESLRLSPRAMRDGLVAPADSERRVADAA